MANQAQWWDWRDWTKEEIGAIFSNWAKQADKGGLSLREVWAELEREAMREAWRKRASREAVEEWVEEANGVLVEREEDEASYWEQLECEDGIDEENWENLMDDLN